MLQQMLDMIELTPQQEETVSRNMKIGAIKELGRKGLLTAEQVRKILFNVKF